MRLKIQKLDAASLKPGGVYVLQGRRSTGKSTLLNALAERPAAIVSPTAGTTRDVVQVTLELGGLPVIISDTAGLREQTDDPIEVQGMLRAASEARKANIQLWVYDAGDPPVDSLQLDAEQDYSTFRRNRPIRCNISCAKQPQRQVPGLTYLLRRQSSTLRIAAAQ